LLSDRHVHAAAPAHCYGPFFRNLTAGYPETAGQFLYLIRRVRHSGIAHPLTLLLHEALHPLPQPAHHFVPLTGKLVIWLFSVLKEEISPEISAGETQTLSISSSQTPV
jgi:hypothetical protein